MRFADVIASLSVLACTGCGLLLSTWAVRNALRWHHHRYVVGDFSAAEADAGLFWMQSIGAAITLLIAAVLARHLLRRWRTLRKATGSPGEAADR